MPRAPLPVDGLVYFWFLNDHCPLDELRRQIAEFARAKVAAVALHARAGLLVPYGGSAWFDLIRTLVKELLAAGVQPWLYDEQPYPSGSAGGWITAERPELAARAMERFVAPPEQSRDGALFLFPTGKLLWAGAVPPAGSDAAPIELTAAVGTIMRQWEVTPWDSRWYYSTTPLYSCPRSEAAHPEFGLRVPAGAVPAGWTLVAYVARPIVGSQWGHLADSLNPEATRLYIERTHDRYAAALGDLLGSAVPAIFTDEAKPHCSNAWTPGMFEEFTARFGYDLRPRLEDLFHDHDAARCQLTRLHYRQWRTQRFIDAWIKPVADWCKAHDVLLVGHVSPEDDPLEQVNSLGNLFPIQRHLGLAGFDLILPAVGDDRHAVLNVGVTVATSVCQQQGMPGVMSETLGANGPDLSAAMAAKILAWQTLSGVGTIVLHGAFASTLGLRRWDAPPDSGPDSIRWKGMCETQEGLRPFQRVINGGATQTAPVAILWPIRSFQARYVPWLSEDVGPRRDFTQLLLACLQAQVGVHLLDEEQLASATLRDGRLVIGRASYQTLLLPTVAVLSRDSLRRLDELGAAGFAVHAFTDAPRYAQTERGLDAVSGFRFPRVVADDWTAWCRAQLPRLLDLQGDDTRGLRASAWTDAAGVTTWLLMNLDEVARSARLGGQTIALAPGQLLALRREGAAWRTLHTFAPGAVTANRAYAPTLALTGWQARWDGGAWAALERPLAAYQLVKHAPIGAQPLVMPITGWAAHDGTVVADAIEYRATVQVPSPLPKRLTLVLEPTAQRGALRVEFGARSWDVVMSDTGEAPTRIDLGDAVKPGANELRITVTKPMSLDGVKWAPDILVG